MNARSLIALVALEGILAVNVQANQVTPRNSVTSHVNIRNAAGADVGDLLPGQRLPYLDSAGLNHRVRLLDGSDGFVSKRCTNFVPDSVDPAAVTGGYCTSPRWYSPSLDFHGREFT